ncbi:hypothetical protein F5884DRAFT_759109 [Xylogone sp. PMI_703]|nr:hypothetical protein F5884DRAFT_759109 [Xylogone sp. PMI_703]
MHFSTITSFIFPAVFTPSILASPLMSSHSLKNMVSSRQAAFFKGIIVCTEFDGQGDCATITYDSGVCYDFTGEYAEWNDNIKWLQPAGDINIGCTLYSDFDCSGVNVTGFAVGSDPAREPYNLDAGQIDVISSFSCICLDDVCSYSQ